MKPYRASEAECRKAILEAAPPGMTVRVFAGLVRNWKQAGRRPVVYQRDSEPASGLRPTVGWAPNEIVQDNAGLFVPPDAAPGTYRLQIVLYNSATVQNLTTPSGELFTLDRVKVIAP